MERIFSGNPRSSILICAACLSKILRTILSPYDDGNVDTLTSTLLSPRDKDTLPSWGSLLSEMSKPEIIFILEIRTEAILLSCLSISLSIPSILNRTIMLSSYGSKWISEALFFIAWLITPLINLIIGVSLLPLRRSSVAFMLPAKSCKSNSSESSSDISLSWSVIENEFVRISLNFSESHNSNLKLEFWKSLQENNLLQLSY